MQQKRASYNKSVYIFQQTHYQQADLRMRSHGMRQLVDDMSVASCQQTCCMLIVKLVIHRLAASCNKSAKDILTNFLQLDEIDKFVAAC